MFSYPPGAVTHRLFLSPELKASGSDFSADVGTLWEEGTLCDPSGSRLTFTKQRLFLSQHDSILNTTVTAVLETELHHTSALTLETPSGDPSLHSGINQPLLTNPSPEFSFGTGRDGTALSEIASQI